MIFTETPFETYDVETPCCAVPIALRWTPFRHRGGPTRADQRFVLWNAQCPACRASLAVASEVRLRRVRSISGTYDTYGRLVGGWIWTTRESAAQANQR